MKKHIVVSMALAMLVNTGCGDKKAEEAAQAQQAQTSKEVNEIEQRNKKVEQLNEEYREMPDEKLFENNGQNGPVYTELKKRYSEQLATLKQKVEGTGAKFVVVLITPEVGKGMTDFTRYGHPHIKATCAELGIEYYDLGPAIASQDAHVITQVPKDGHWSKKGAIFLADQLDPILKKHAGHKSTTTYKDTERPETFGDLAPNSDEVLDGGKDLPYRLIGNAQGLRMDHNVKFPKAKQHILFMGGSQIYSPFLDNEFIATSILQQRHPDMEVMNAAMWAGCTDDFLSLWDEKAKYSEPDVVIVQTNGTDIPDLFFSNRNHLARSKKPYYPSEVEEKYFRERYRK
ncbi:hypothetical protein GCM10023093_10690 [Nemorincola caseinilytica]|uniref:AlgX/AlgJ SGNH hydrolase-like domain-containing protein n=1 Tax=Nemorincola caseinilytica TaxID=2054315 RepID=A0ABP8NB96_9BACT